MIKLLQIKDRMKYFFPPTTLTESKMSNPRKEPITPTAPLDDGTPRKRSLGSPVNVDRVHPEPQVQVHSPPRTSHPASRYNPLSDEEETAPQCQIPVQKEEEPVQTIIQQIVKDTETC